MDPLLSYGVKLDDVYRQAADYIYPVAGPRFRGGDTTACRPSIRRYRKRAISCP